jgi:hypothetical protein
MSFSKPPTHYRPDKGRMISTMQTVTLRNGSEELDSLVNATMMSLRQMMGDILGITALYDLHQICLGTNYRPSARQLEYLKERCLLQANGRPHDSIKNIVLSAIEGEGPEMTLVSPLA